jgi:hypothetical protein
VIGSLNTPRLSTPFKPWNTHVRCKKNTVRRLLFRSSTVKTEDRNRVWISSHNNSMITIRSAKKNEPKLLTKRWWQLGRGKRAR